MEAVGLASPDEAELGQRRLDPAVLMEAQLINKDLSDGLERGDLAAVKACDTGVDRFNGAPHLEGLPCSS